MRTLARKEVRFGEGREIGKYASTYPRNSAPAAQKPALSPEEKAHALQCLYHARYSGRVNHSDRIPESTQRSTWLREWKNNEGYAGQLRSRSPYKVEG